jgi:hypothetical protein
MNKKGVSPIIATVILISIAMIVVVIIFLAARGFLSERALKNGEVIENSCDDILFEAEPYLGGEETLIVDVQNNGDIPIYAIELRYGSFGDLDVDTSSGASIENGGYGQFEFDIVGKSDINEVRIIPIIIGETDSGEKKSYVCDEDYGKEYSLSES